MSQLDFGRPGGEDRPVEDKDMVELWNRVTAEMLKVPITPGQVVDWVEDIHGSFVVAGNLTNRRCDGETLRNNWRDAYAPSDGTYADRIAGVESPDNNGPHLVIDNG